MFCLCFCPDFVFSNWVLLYYNDIQISFFLMYECVFALVHAFACMHAFVCVVHACFHALYHSRKLQCPYHVQIFLYYEPTYNKLFVLVLVLVLILVMNVHWIVNVIHAHPLSLMCDPSILPFWGVIIALIFAYNALALCSSCVCKVQSV